MERLLAVEWFLCENFGNNRMLLKRGMGNGEWGMGNGEWGMGNGKWEMGNGKLKMGN